MSDGVLHATSRGASRRPLAVLVLLLAIALAAFWPSISALMELWSHPERRTYQHGYVIAAIALWLLYRERRRIIEATARPAPSLLVLAAAGGVAWAVAWNAGVQAAHILLWPAILWAAAAGALGLRAGRVLARPIVFLYFAMPIWDALIPGLQAATVLANNLLATVIGMPVLIEGNYIHIPEGTFEIAGGCSGLNYLIVGLAIAALLGEVNRDGPGRRLLLIAIGGGLAIASNWLRVFIIIYAGHVTDMDHYLVRVDHYNFGWVLYAFVLALFFFIARKLPESRATAGADPDLPAVPSSDGRSIVWGAIATAILVLGPWLAGTVRLVGTDVHSAGAGVGVSQIELPQSLEWRPAPAIGDWVPIFPGADAESLVEFAQGESRVTAYTATYLRQAQGRELIGHDSRIEGDAAGRLTLSGVKLVADPAVRVMDAQWRSAGGSEAIIWWTYRIGSRDFANGLRAQLWYGLASLWSDPVSAIVALRSECRPDCGQARLALQEFAADALPGLLAAASRTGELLE
ncbi:MAG: exosortase A [Steroidobacteraceae bacterium]